MVSWGAGARQRVVRGKAKDAAPLALTAVGVVLLMRACLYGIPVPWPGADGDGATGSPPDNGARQAPGPGLPPATSLSEEELAVLLEPVEPHCPTPWNQVRHLQWTEAPPLCIDTEAEHTATLVTSRGDIVIELDTENAPNTVNNFVFLARWHVYDGVEFNPVYPDYALNTGDPLGDPVGTFDPGYSIPDENLPRSKDPVYPDYSVSMGTGGPGTASAVFAIAPEGPGDYRPWFPLFGQITDQRSKSVVNAIEATGVRQAGHDGTPTQPTIIHTVTIQAQPPSRPSAETRPYGGLMRRKVVGAGERLDR